MSKHTKEPWILLDEFIEAKDDKLNDGYYTAQCPGPDAQANARRITACVNAFTDMKTEHVEELADMGNGVVQLLVRADDYRLQCDELLAVLTTLVGNVDGSSWGNGAYNSKDDWDNARRVIAKVKAAQGGQ